MNPEGAEDHAEDPCRCGWAAGAAGHLAGCRDRRSVSSCTAAGGYFTKAGHEYTLAEHRNGTAWSIQPTSSPASGRDAYSQLNAVWCAAADQCTAVGLYGSSGPRHTLAEVWNGHTWTVPSTPKISGSLDAIAAVPSGALTAVGVAQVGSSPGRTVQAPGRTPRLPRSRTLRLPALAGSHWFSHVGMDSPGPAGPGPAEPYAFSLARSASSVRGRPNPQASAPATRAS